MHSTSDQMLRFSALPLLAVLILAAACVNADKLTSTLPGDRVSESIRMSRGVPSVTPVPAGAVLPVRAGNPENSPLFTSSSAAAVGVRYALGTATAPTIAASVVGGPQTPSLIWIGTDGSATLWEMNGPSWSGGGATVLQIPSPWKLATAADLNADGSPDLIWEATDGTRAVTFMNGGAYAGSYAMMFVIPPEWKIVGSADFNSDNKPDLVLANSNTGDNGVLFLNGTAWTGTFSSLPNISSPLRIAAVGNMDGVASPDLIVQNTTSGQISVYYLVGTTFVQAVALVGNDINPGASWRVVAVGDFDGNLNNDIVMQNTTDGSRQIWLMWAWYKVGYFSLETVPVTQSIVAAAPVQWPATDVYFVNTGAPPPPPNQTFLNLLALGRPDCNIKPACLSRFSKAGGKFTLASRSTLDLVEAWVLGGDGAAYVNIRADSAGLPGSLIFSKGYFLGNFNGFPPAPSSPGWMPFSQYNAVLNAGTYWVTFEGVPNTNMIGQMPGGAPSPMLNYAATTEAFPWSLWGSSVALGVRISGRLTP